MLKNQEIKLGKLAAVALSLTLLLSLSWSVSQVYAAPPIAPYVTSTTNVDNDIITLTGTADPGATIRITGGDSTVNATTSFGGIWTAMVDTDSSDPDRLSITAANAMGERSEVNRFMLDGMRNLVGDEEDDEDDNDDDETSEAIVIAGTVFTP